jgi:hypothetical protein
MQRKRTLHPGQGLVATHCICVAERLIGQAGVHDIKPIGRRLGGDLGSLAGEVEAVVGNIQIEMLFIL